MESCCSEECPTLYTRRRSGKVAGTERIGESGARIGRSSAWRDPRQPEEIVPLVIGNGRFAGHGIAVAPEALDGEIEETTALRCRVLPGAFQVIMPERTGAGSGSNGENVAVHGRSGR
jgi:hypothetical protein